MASGKLRKLFTNDEVTQALETGEALSTGTDALAIAAAELSALRGVPVSQQILRYWALHLNSRKKNGEPYIGTLVLDRKLAGGRKLRKRPVPAVAQTEVDNSCILLIPDQHAPYNHPDAIPFLSDVADHYSPTRIINLGDETDGHALSMHDSDPNLDAAGPELYAARKFVAQLHNLFPAMEICHSNHGSLVYRRALKTGIPVEYIKPYRDVLFPDGDGQDWNWYDRIEAILPNGDKTIFQHQSSGGILANAAHERANIVQGHEHGRCEINYRASTTALYWAMIPGCLIDNAAMAFAYGKLFPKKPIIGCGAIVDSQPVLIPMPMDAEGRYTGKLGGLIR